MRRTLYAGILAAALSACASLPSLYQSIDDVIAHPQNYNGCEIKVRGRPRFTGGSYPAPGRMRVEFDVVSGDKALPSHCVIDSSAGKRLSEEFDGRRIYIVSGTYVADGTMRGSLRAEHAANADRSHDFN